MINNKLLNTKLKVIVQEFCKGKGKTQGVLANHLGVTQPAVHSWVTKNKSLKDIQFSYVIELHNLKLIDLSELLMKQT